MVSGEEETEDEERICFGQFIFTVSLSLCTFGNLFYFIIIITIYDELGQYCSNFPPDKPGMTTEFLHIN